EPQRASHWRRASAIGSNGNGPGTVPRRLMVGPANHGVDPGSTRGSTLGAHVNRIFYKTGARDRAQAVRYAYEHGIPRPPDEREVTSTPGCAANRPDHRLA